MPSTTLFPFFGGVGSLINPFKQNKGTLFKPRLLGSPVLVLIMFCCSWFFSPIWGGGGGLREKELKFVKLSEFRVTGFLGLRVVGF